MGLCSNLHGWSYAWHGDGALDYRPSLHNIIYLHSLCDLIIYHDDVVYYTTYKHYIGKKVLYGFVYQYMAVCFQFFVDSTDVCLNSSKTAEDVSAREYNCQLCVQKFPRKSSLVMHYTLYHKVHGLNKSNCCSDHVIQNRPRKKTSSVTHGFRPTGGHTRWKKKAVTSIETNNPG